MNILNKKWDSFLELYKLENVEWYQDILSFISKVYQENKRICPEQKDIFHMFDIMDPEDIKVMLIFQDPYPQLRKGKCITNGIGLAASYMTHSLKHFSQATNILGKFDTTMMSLIKQGVFSINKFHTVEVARPMSHSPYLKSIYERPLRWDLFTTLVIQRLKESYDNIVYIFFGAESQMLASILDNTNNLVIKTSHPSNRGYKYGLMTSNFAQRTNEYLKQNNKTEIKWKLNIK